MPDANVHQVLWTGGWDSTFRVCELLLVHGRTVQPWYVIDRERRTTAREMRTMARIAAEIERRDRDARARLLRPQVRERADLEIPADLAAAARSVRARYRLPEQYVFLAALVEAEQVATIEIAIDERREMPYLRDAVLAAGPGPAPDDWWSVDPEDNPADLARIFAGMRLPVCEMTKTDMEMRAKAAGFADVLELTWFCRWPTILGHPCGQCVPCSDLRGSALERRIPPDSDLRRRLHRWRWGWVRQAESARIRARAAGERLRG